MPKPPPKNLAEQLEHIASANLLEHERDFARTILIEDFQRVLQGNLNSYKLTKNGLFLWEAFTHCQSNGQAIPASVLAKFSEWGRAVIEAETPAGMLEALELKGDTKSYKGKKGHSATKRNLAIAQQVEIAKLLPKFKTDARAIGLVAKNFKLSVSVVKKAYYMKFSQQSPTVKRALQSQNLDSAMRSWGR